MSEFIMTFVLLLVLSLIVDYMFELNILTSVFEPFVSNSPKLEKVYTEFYWQNFNKKIKKQGYKFEDSKKYLTNQVSSLNFREYFEKSPLVEKMTTKEFEENFNDLEKLERKKIFFLTTENEEEIRSFETFMTDDKIKKVNANKLIETVLVEEWKQGKKEKIKSIPKGYKPTELFFKSRKFKEQKENYDGKEELGEYLYQIFKKRVRVMVFIEDNDLKNLESVKENFKDIQDNLDVFIGKGVSHDDVKDVFKKRPSKINSPNIRYRYKNDLMNKRLKEDYITFYVYDFNRINDNIIREYFNYTFKDERKDRNNSSICFQPTDDILEKFSKNKF